MDFHYRQRLTVEQLAAQAHLSPSRFAHLFRQEVGTSPMRHLEQVRLQQARRLLASTHLTVSEVADVLGYCNVFHFSKVFRDHVGQPPSQFRQQHEPQIAPADQPRDA
jgi:AraC family transcriptional regulator of arabinose operon